MNININTTYEIGDVLYLEQSNGGGLRKVQLEDVIFSLKYRSTIFILSRRAALISKNGFLICLSNRVTEQDILRSIKYWRRGNNWLIPMPEKERVIGTQYKESNNE